MAVDPKKKNVKMINFKMKLRNNYLIFLFIFIYIFHQYFSHLFVKTWTVLPPGDTVT